MPQVFIASLLVEKQKKDIRSRLKDIEIPQNLVTLGNVVQEGNYY